METLKEQADRRREDSLDEKGRTAARKEPGSRETARYKALWTSCCAMLLLLGAALHLQERGLGELAACLAWLVVALMGFQLYMALFWKGGE